jgi:site-specific DNA-methyltransferase (adenine-specific)
MIKPYYQDEWVTIYNGDCREILPELPKVDLVLTDPPYGIADKWVGGFSDKHGWGKALKDQQVRNSWDSETPSIETIRVMLDKSTYQIIWGGNYLPLPLSRCWLIWIKPERNFSLAEAEMAWTNADNVVRVFDCHRNDTGKQHPTQKPLSLMKWCLSLSWSDKCQTVLDPFMGSGTTLRAAKELGRHSIGIEINEAYCEIAAKRCMQTVMNFEPVKEKPKQGVLMS